MLTVGVRITLGCKFLMASPLRPSGDYTVRLTTDLPGEVVISVTRAWAPLGADQFRKIVESNFYREPSAVFRVVPDWVVQCYAIATFDRLPTTEVVEGSMISPISIGVREKMCGPDYGRCSL